MTSAQHALVIDLSEYRRQRQAKMAAEGRIPSPRPPVLWCWVWVFPFNCASVQA